MIPANNSPESWTFAAKAGTLGGRIWQGTGMYEGLSEEDFTRHFMPRIAVPDHETWLAEDFEASARARDRLAHRRNERYGPGPLQLIDLFPATAPGSPILVFIHGGYWRALSKDHYGFIAEPLIEAGGAINGAPDRLVLAGNSAGAHLAAMMLSRDWGEDEGNDLSTAGFIRGAALVTGIYDLAPIPRIQVREDVRLTAAEIDALSPLRLLPRSAAPSVVAVGGAEPALWIEQSRRYHRKLSDAGMETEFMIIPGHHHFSITRCLAEPDSPLFRSVVRLLKR